MIKLAFPIRSAIFIILSKKLGVSLLGPYNQIIRLLVLISERPSCAIISGRGGGVT